MQSTEMSKGAEHLDCSRIAQDLQIRRVQVESVVQLLDEGNTVPFITRYRKERTGGLNEEIIRLIQERIGQMRALADRKQTILKSIENQGKLTDELKAAILAAEHPKRLEDLYLPYKPKKRSLASDARDRGLEPLALAVWNRDPAALNLPELLTGMVNPEKGLHTPDDVLAGVQHILAEMIAETANVRSIVRMVLWESAKLSTAKHEKLPENQGLDFKDYFQFTEPIRHIPPHRILAINRGEKENALQGKLDFDAARVMEAALSELPLADHPHAEFLKTVADDALSRLLLPSLEREIRRELTIGAEQHAVSVFARNLRSLLLAPPLRSKRVLAIDPGFRTGCKVAVLDEIGNLLQDVVIYPHPPQNKKNDARLKLEELVRRHQVQVIAIGNGTACRETEELVSDLIALLERRRSGIVDPPANGPTSAPVPVPMSAPELSMASMTIEMPPLILMTPPAPAVPEMPPPTESVALEASPSMENAASETPPTESATSETPPSVECTAPPVLVETVATPVPAPPPPAPAPAPMTLPPDLPEADADLAYIIVNEAGASVYSASAVGREEFPNFDATTRGTISIGRRLQDPLSELVKIDPQNIGVGLYQHDVNPRQLKDSLDGVIESCVNQVGVDLNTASVPLLRHVSGLNQLVARELVEYRKQNGPFRQREQLLQVSGVGPARYIQAAGFLKIAEGNDPLDRTWIHPESYPAARQLLADLGYQPEVLLDKARLEELREKLKPVPVEETAARLQLGEPTLRDILDALARPGRDPREDLPPPIFKKGILKLEDLQAGMELKGTVLNVVDFGAFIDIGLKDSGLVHISRMANRYIKNPYEVVAVGDVVAVWVVEVDSQRRRVSLTMIKPGTERKPPERGAPQQQRGEQGERGDRGPRSDRPRGRRPAQAGGGGGRGPARPGGGGGRGPRPAPQGAPPQGAAPPEGTTQAEPPPQQSRDGGRGRGPAQRGPQQPPPPPRKPKRAMPKPKLTQEALKGETPLRTFSELSVFWETKDEEKKEPAPEPPSKPEEPPPAQS